MPCSSFRRRREVSALAARRSRSVSVIITSANLRCSLDKGDVEQVVSSFNPFYAVVYSPVIAHAEPVVVVGARGTSLEGFNDLRPQVSAVNSYRQASKISGEL